MASNEGVLIEAISKQTFDDMNKLIKQLNEQITLTNTLTKDFKKLKLPSQVTKAQKETASAVKSTSKAVSDYAKQLKVLENAQKKQMQASSSLGRQITKRRFETQQLNRANKEEAVLTSRLSTEYQKQQVKLTRLNRTYADLALKKQLNGKLSKQEERLLKRTKIALDKKDRALKAVDAQMGKNNRHVGNYKRGLMGLTNSMGTLITAFGVFGAIQITREIFNQVKALDSLNKALLVVVGTQSALIDTQSFLNKLADKSGTDILSLSKAYTKFFASAKTTNLTLEDTRKIFENTALAGAALGLSTDDVNGAMRALEQMLSKGNVQAEEIRGQLGERLPGAFQILAKSMGLTTKELNKQLELGNVLAEEVLPKFADELAKTFGLGTIQRIDTVVAAQNRMSNEWTLFIKSVEDGGGIFSKVFKNMFLAVSSLLETFRLMNTSQAELFDIAKAQGYEETINNIGKAAKKRGLAEKELAELEIKNVAKRVSTLRKLLKEEEARNKTLIFGTKEQAKSNTLIREINELLGKKVGIHEALDDIINDNVKVQKELNKTNEDGTVIIIDQNKALQAQHDKLKQLFDLLKEQQAARIAFNKKMKEDAEAGIGTVDTSGLESVPTTTDDPLFDADEMEQLRQAVLGVTDALGISEMTVNSFFDAFEDGTFTATEAMESFALLAVDAINMISAAQRKRTMEQIDRLQTEKEIALAFAGESAAARGEIEDRFAEKRKKLLEKQAKEEQKAAIIKAIINTAVGVTGAAPVIPLMAIIAALGAAQVAIIASQPLPKFEKGTMNSPEGIALVNEKRNEVIVNPKGEVFRPQGRNQLVNLDKGSKVFKSEADFDRELGGLLGGNGINSYGIGAGVPIVNVIGNSLTAEDMEQAFKNALKGRANNVTNIDKNGFSTYAVGQLTKRNILNNRISFKGKNV